MLPEQYHKDVCELFIARLRQQEDMMHTNKKELIGASNCIAPTPRPLPSPPEITPYLRLKWGLALLGKEKAAEYLAWVQARLHNGPR